jgi:hypothetical protein
MQSKFVLQPFAPHSQFSVIAYPEKVWAESVLPVASRDRLQAAKHPGTLITTPVPVILRGPNDDDFLNRSVVAERCGVQDPNTGVLTYVIYREQLERPEYETILRFYYREIEPVLYPSQGTDPTAWQIPIHKLREDTYLSYLFVSLVFGRNETCLTHKEEQKLLQCIRKLSSFQRLDAAPAPADSNKNEPASDDSSAITGDQADASPTKQYQHLSAGQAKAAGLWDCSEVRQRHELPVFTEIMQRLEGQIADNGEPVIDAFADLLLNHENADKLEQAVRRIAQRLEATAAGGSHE